MGECSDSNSDTLQAFFSAKMEEMDQRRVNILGVQLSAINMDQALHNIHEWISLSQPHYVCCTPIHGIMDCVDNPELRAIFNASGMTTPDGMGVVWLLRLQGYKRVRRVYGPDLMLEVCRLSCKHGWRHFLYGGEPMVAERLKQSLIDRFPDLKVVGLYSPPFRELSPAEDEDIVEEINTLAPDIVWVGISTPKQERWMKDHTQKLNAKVLIGVGAAFDFLSGSKKQAPRWIQKIGMEWLFRLLNEPKRLGRRYIKYPHFLVLVIAQMMKIRNFPTE